MRRLLCLLVLLIFGMLPIEAQKQPAFEPADCPFGNLSPYRIDCGWLVAPDGVRLAVAIIRSKNPQKADDPIVYLAGGPGAAFVETAPIQVFNFGFASLLAERDIILVDQRGMGLSQPSLRCVPYDSGLDLSRPDFPQPAFEARVNACQEALAAQGIDYTQFDTPHIAADFAALPEALGYDEVNLYGTSWGTRLGLVILRDYPEGIRSVILDSTLPPQVDTFGAPARLGEASFSQAEQLCAADTLCRTAYPNLRAVFEQTYADLQANPVPLTLGVPLTGDMFAGQVAVLLRDKAGVERLPGFIYSIAQGDYRSFADQIADIAEATPDKLPDMGIFFSIVCREGATTQAAIEAKMSAYPAAFQSMAKPFFGTGGYDICQMWGDVLPLPNDPAVSDVPVLLLAGQHDPLTPPEWAYLAAETLSKAYVYEFPARGHVLAGEGCAQTIMVSFLRSPDTAPDAACIATLSAPNFALNIHITRPVVQIAALLLSAVGLWGLGHGVSALMRGRSQLTWHAAFKHAGWIAPMLTLVVVVLLILDPDSPLLPSALSRETIIQLILPLATAVQAAMIFSPDEEPGLEIQLALPRPLSWLVLERLAVILLMQMLVALVASALIVALEPGMNIAVLLVGWIPSALFLSGLALQATLSARIVAAGIAAAGTLWFAFLLLGDLFLPGGSWSFPLNILQPFLWPLNVHARPEHLSLGDYWLNRLFLFAAGIGFLMMVVRRVNDTEAILLNVSQKQRRKQPLTEQATPLRASVRLTPVPVIIEPLRQIIGLARYEFKMQWRRRGIKLLTAVMLAGVLIGAVLFPVDMQSIASLPPIETLTAEQAQTQKGLALALLMSLTLLAALTFVLPLLVVDAIPIEYAHQTDELMRSLPVGRGVYLAGKVTGTWLATLSSLALAVALSLLVWGLRVGAFNPTFYFDMLLTGAIPLLLTNGACAVLIGATQTSQQRAVILLLVVLLLPPFLFGSIVPGGMTLLEHYVGQAMEGAMYVPPVIPAGGLTFPVVTRTLLVGLAQAGVWWIVIWLWMRRREARQ